MDIGDGREDFGSETGPEQQAPVALEPWYSNAGIEIVQTAYQDGARYLCCGPATLRGEI